MGGLFGGGKKTTIDNGSVANFQINQATYGIVVPVILGTSRQQGNVIDYYGFTKIPHSETQRTGKGGGGGSSTTTVTYTYKAAVLIALCEGKIDGVGKVWVDTDTITTLAAAGITLFDGSIGQSPWSYTTSVNPEHALPYSGLAYVAGYVDLSSNGALQNYNFEIQGQLRSTGNGVDVNPADASIYVLTDVNNGLGFTADNMHTVSLNKFKLFCKASNLFVTVPMTDQSKAHEITNKLCEMTNTIVFWSQRKIKFVPRCEEAITGNDVTYTPNTVPEYDLDADDFLENDDGKLVEWERTDNAETYNQVTVEFTNRANGYETETVEYQILADVNDRGPRPMSTVSYPWIHDKATAERVAQQIAMDSCYGRNTYTFKLGLAHSLLEPGDIVTLTETAIGLKKLPVMIENVTEDGDEAYSFVAKYRPVGTYSPAKYETYESERASIDKNIDPGDINPPIIFEPPSDVTATGLETWIGVSGGTNWGGCNVWISEDESAYKMVGTINNPSRMGTVVADTGSVIMVDMSISRAELLSGTQLDAENLNTLCYIDGELLAYQTASLVAANQYDLSGLVRGAYYTAEQAHAAGNQFLRLDDYIFKYPFKQEQVGKTIYLKFTSFNAFGAAEQDLADVEPYSHQIIWAPPPDVTSYFWLQNLRQVEHHWEPVGDVSGVEIRRLDTNNPVWESGQLVDTNITGNTYIDNVIQKGIWTYGIKAIGKNGSYSANMRTYTMGIDAVPQSNIIVAMDEMQVLDGTPTNCYIDDGKIIVDIMQEWDEDTALEWDEATAQEWGAPFAISAVSAKYRTQVKDIGKIMLSILGLSGFSFNGQSSEIWWAFSDTDTVLDDTANWQKFMPGAYKCRYYAFELRLVTDGAYAEVTDFRVNIDVPDRTLIYPNEEMPIVQITDASAGVEIIFAEPFLKFPKATGTILDSDAQIYIASADLHTDRVTVRAMKNGAFVTGVFHPIIFSGY